MSAAAAADVAGATDVAAAAAAAAVYLAGLAACWQFVVRTQSLFIKKHNCCYVRRMILLELSFVFRYTHHGCFETVTLLCHTASWWTVQWTDDRPLVAVKETINTLKTLVLTRC